MSAINLPLPLRQVLESGDCVLFLGAGLGHHMTRPNGSKAPDGAELAKELSDHFSLGVTSFDLPRVSELVELRHSRQELDTFVKKALADLEPDELVRWLTTFRWRAIFTTNYDRGIERAYELNAAALQNAVPISATSDMENTDPRFEVPIFHLHGTPFGPSTSPIVITLTDYARYQEKRKMLWNRLKNEFATSTLLYIGYSGKDPNWKVVLDEIRREFYPSQMPQSFRIDPHSDDIDVEIFAAQRLHTLICNLREFYEATEEEIGDRRPEYDLVSRNKGRIPAHLQEQFEANPAMVLRLLDSWEYVNAADFGEPPNIDAFLRGDRPNWSLINSGRKFVRDIEESMWERTAEFATTPAAKSTAISLIAPAGYGVTTSLLTLATKIVGEKIGPVFMLKEGGEVLEGDIAFAATLFSDVPAFFFIDQAREHAHAISVALVQQRRTKTNCLFVVGERKNEWRMTDNRLRAEEFEIEPLSDGEINRMLDFLASENALGELEHLDRDFQFRIVRDKHEKELLVAMREATAGEGVGFDAILENEYRGIDDGGNLSASARELYLLVCCFYQHGVLVRDRLLQDILGQPLDKLYAATSASLEGLVDVRETDVARGEFALRARHRTIAEIVWKKCGTQDRKEALLQSAMERLNLSYRLDKTVFERFTRSDEIAETFRTLEGKINFFNAATSRAPDDPYVLQHFARMLLRNKQLKLALSQANIAIAKDRDKSIRVLRHTKGTILAALAIAEESDDVGRKWLAQSEREFKSCIDSSPTDDYGYVGLANLYIDWAKRADGTDEATEYLTKAEGGVSDGLGKVRERESLLIASAEIEKILGNDPRRIAKLLQAVAANSASVIGRYLLGKIYRSRGQPEMTIEVLDPVVRSDFGEVRSYIEYVKAMIDVGESYAKCWGTLGLCRLDGMSYPAFVGLYAGLLYMDNKFDEATKVWTESIDKVFAYKERFKTQFRPRDPNDRSRPLRLEGTVSKVLPGTVVIVTSSTPSFVGTRTMFGSTFLSRGQRVSFEPTFSAKGSYAEKLIILP